MWLLDANIDVHLVATLSNLGVIADTAANRGWKALSNGELVAAAVMAGFDCVLTRDQLFAESAARALKLYQNFAVVLVTLPQQRWPVYRQRFRHAWSISAIVVCSQNSIIFQKNDVDVCLQPCYATYLSVMWGRAVPVTCYGALSQLVDSAKP